LEREAAVRRDETRKIADDAAAQTNDK